YHLLDIVLIEKKKRLDQPDDETGAALVYVQAKHVLLQLQPPLDNVAGRRHEMVGRLGDEDEGADLLSPQQSVIKEVLKAEDGEIRHAHVRTNEAMLIVAH